MQLNAQLYHGKEITGMVLIPAGHFMMGAANNGDASPAHLVQLDSFYIDRFEVTNAQYLEFCTQTNHALPEFWNLPTFKSGPAFPSYPVIGISWYDASAYAKWAGKRLPTEAEWEYAARGGIAEASFPVGEAMDTLLANFTFAGKRKGLMPVGSFGPNGYGLYDMAGNVEEWVTDWYAPEYYASGDTVNPKGVPSGRFRIIRGGGWHSGKSCVRVYYRNALPPQWIDFAVGFRCVKQ
jgi:formylglycine-generating enzyme